MLAKAFENPPEHRGHILRTVQADWRWLNRGLLGEFDAIICLGSLLTQLFDETDAGRWPSSTRCSSTTAS
jgi:hypothetical protein